ncbi:helix-turn-helix domain-containing protein [Leptotrichia hongkongensis]|uniref:helix-turn-helix domain-containing protein n=1 Tax=Leptotrichia hongkongensis TaxID=554406 RepID=UPI0035A92449
MIDILTDKMTDKELQRLKIVEQYFEKNNYIENSEAQKILNTSDSTERRFLNKLLKNGILEAVGENKGRKY